VLACTVFTFGAWLVCSNSSWHNAFFAPGGLSENHAQLLNRQGEKRCQACHERGDQGWSRWVAATFGIDASTNEPGSFQQVQGPRIATRQSDLCLACHEKQMPRENARGPHHRPPDELAQRTTIAAARKEAAVVPRSKDEIACAACHREHHGADADLSEMREQTCHTCHQTQFHSFSNDHPEFVNWPYERRTRIAFDHASHSLRHFVDAQREFVCTTCHTQHQSGQMLAVQGYSSCAECHDKKIEQSASTGVPVVALPMLDVELLRESGIALGNWPEAATGDFDGTLPPVMRAMLNLDPEVSQALSLLGPDFDFLDLDLDDPAQVAAVGQVAVGIKRMVARIVDDVNPVGPSESARWPLGHAGLATLARAARDWFPDLASFGSAKDDEIPIGQMDSDTSTNSGLTNPDSSLKISDRIAAHDVRYQRWSIQPETAQVHYRPAGHDDPLMQRWLDMVAHQAGTDWEDLPSSLFGEGASGQCVTCHSVESDLRGRMHVQWRSKQIAGARRFTRFVHTPHLTLAGYMDCEACHRIREHADLLATYRQEHAALFDPGFEPLNRSGCAECHNRRGAGEGCMKCHSYHVLD
jgi:predicted CXXCH cytochrome family protein